MADVGGEILNRAVQQDQIDIADHRTGFQSRSAVVSFSVRTISSARRSPDGSQSLRALSVE